MSSTTESVRDLTGLVIQVLIAGVVLAIAVFIVINVGNAPGISSNPSAQAVVGNVTSSFNITASFIPIIVIVVIAAIVIGIILAMGNRVSGQMMPR